MVARLPQVSGKNLAKALQRIGYQIVSQRGSHIKLKKKTASGPRTVIVPNHKIIRKGTLHGILRSTGLTREDL